MLDQVTIVYFEPATCSHASMAPKMYTPIIILDNVLAHPANPCILNIQAVRVKQFQRLIQAA